MVPTLFNFVCSRLNLTSVSVLYSSRNGWSFSPPTLPYPRSNVLAVQVLTPGVEEGFRQAVSTVNSLPTFDRAENKFPAVIWS